MLAELFASEHRALVRQARKHSRRAQDADDALSDACVQFLRRYEGPAGRDALRWLLVVTKRCAWEVGRKTRARESRTLTGVRRGAADVGFIVADHRRGPAESLERYEDRAEARALIERLESDERDALILQGLGYTYEEIAELRGWTRRKVDRCLTRGRARMRALKEGG